VHTVLSAMPDQLSARDAIDAAIAVDFPGDGAPPLHGKPNLSRYRKLSIYFSNFDLILTYNWGSMDAVMARRICAMIDKLPPLIHHEDGFNADEVERLNPKRNLFRKLALPTAHAVVVPSHLLEGIARQHWGANLPVQRIANGIATARYRDAPDPSALPGFVRRNGDVIVGTIAGLRGVKDLPLLVEALALTPPHMRLVIVGDGPERERIMATVQRLGMAERVHLPGFVADPARVVGLFDIMALSSLSEQQPIAVIEGMAAGLPIVAPPVGDIAAMVSPANAPFIVERGATAIGGALTNLALDPVLRTTLGQANQELAAAVFDEDVMIAAYARLYGEAAGRPGQFG
jgi:L-malate glycosyltransferase